MKINYKGQEFDPAIPFIKGQDLKQMRLQAKVTTSIAAEYMHIKSRKTIENWESGASSPSIQQFIILCRYYDINASKIVARCLERALINHSADNDENIDVASCRI